MRATQRVATRFVPPCFRESDTRSAIQRDHNDRPLRGTWPADDSGVAVASGASPSGGPVGVWEGVTAFKRVEEPGLPACGRVPRSDPVTGHNRPGRLRRSGTSNGAFCAQAWCSYRRTWPSPVVLSLISEDVTRDCSVSEQSRDLRERLPVPTSRGDRSRKSRL